MSSRAEIRARCVICGSENVEHHHVGGQNHIAWFTMPLCVEHHAQLHALLRAAGVDLTYTFDPVERILRAKEACSVFDWMLTKALRELNSRGANETEQCNRA